jgi:hypothetical protein
MERFQGSSGQLGDEALKAEGLCQAETNYFFSFSARWIASALTGELHSRPADGTSTVGSLRISAAPGNLEIDPVSPAQELITNRSTRLTLIILADSQLATQID